MVMSHALCRTELRRFSTISAPAKKSNPDPTSNSSLPLVLTTPPTRHANVKSVRDNSDSKPNARTTASTSHRTGKGRGEPQFGAEVHRKMRPRRSPRAGPKVRGGQSDRCDACIRNRIDAQLIDYVNVSIRVSVIYPQIYPQKSNAIRVGYPMPRSGAGPTCEVQRERVARPQGRGLKVSPSA